MISSDMVSREIFDYVLVTSAQSRDDILSSRWQNLFMYKEMNAFRTDGSTCTPSYRDARTHQKIIARRNFVYSFESMFAYF